MIGILKEFWLVILVILLALIGLILLYVYRKKPFVKQMIVSFVDEAERLLGAKTGPLKFALVVQWLYPKLPTGIKILISEKRLTAWIEKGVKEVEALYEAIKKKKEQDKLIKDG